MLAIPPAELTSLRTVIEYFWQEEREDYLSDSDGARREKHVFLHLVAVRRLYERESGHSLHLDD